jgi:streptomycin 6-kinase
MDELSGYLDRWGLTRDGAEIATRTARLYFVRRGREPAVLKILTGASDEATAPRALRHFAGRGAVRVLKEDRGAVLLQRAMPGTPLSLVVADGHDDAATATIADLILRMHHGRRPPAGWPTLEDWAGGFVRQRARPVHRRLPQRLLDRGEAIFRELAASQGKQFLLHGDLHHDNILRDDAERWLVIDPKGVVGETAYETAVSIRNPMDFYPFQADPVFMARRVAIFAERLSLDRSRILGWYVGQSLLSVCWLIEDGEPEEAVARGVRLAEAGLELLSASV